VLGNELDYRAEHAGRRPLAGQEVRLINIPADAGAGMGVFENLHDFDEPGLLADHLRDASARYYGTAGRAFLLRLVTARSSDPGFYERVRRLRQQFINDHLPTGSDGQVRSVCGRLGVIAAAGELATEWNILPWNAGEATQAAATCFMAWLGERGGIGAGEVQIAFQQVRAFIEAHGMSRFGEIRQYSTTVGGQHISSPNEELHDDRTINRCGWRRHDGEQWTYFVLPLAWRTEVCRGIDSQLAARALADRGWLKREGKNLTVKETIPGHGRPRVYAVSGALLEGDAD
jgi:uncharacterized protein (DUF927 family)